MQESCPGNFPCRRQVHACALKRCLKTASESFHCYLAGHARPLNTKACRIRHLFHLSKYFSTQKECGRHLICAVLVSKYIGLWPSKLFEQAALWPSEASPKDIQ